MFYIRSPSFPGMEYFCTVVKEARIEISNYILDFNFRIRIFQKKIIGLHKLF